MTVLLAKDGASMSERSTQVGSPKPLLVEDSGGRGAEIYASAPPHSSRIGDIRDYSALRASALRARPPAVIKDCPVKNS
jgi:hypothetical protein